MTEPMNDAEIAAMVAELRDMANKIPALWPDKAADMLEFLQSQLADTQEAYDDTKRLAREIDIAMHGVGGAAKQASLCDLVHPAADLRAQLAAMTEARDAAPVRVGVLTEAVEKLGLRKLVAGWNGEHRQEPYAPHPQQLGVTLKTTAGVVYEIDAALRALAEGTQK